MRKKLFNLLATFLTIALILVACTNAPRPITATSTSEVKQTTPTITPTAVISIATETKVPPTEQNPTPPPPIFHQTTPEVPPVRIDSLIQDPDSSPYANSQMVAQGDNFYVGVFERPFNSGSMNQYFPDLDILEARMSLKEPWIYASITLKGVNKGSLLTGSYGIEIDIDQDGRGDVLITAQSPGLTWSTQNVRAWRDANHDVGGQQPVYPDQGMKSDGYEQLVFDSGKGFDVDAAWARIDPDNLNTLQIVFKHKLIDNDKAFLWRAWAQSEIQPGWFDYNDHFTLVQAGSPLKEQAQAYPLGALAEVDNTCRWGFGVTPDASEPGVCLSQLQLTPTTGVTGIQGMVWYDRNANFVQDPGEPGLANAVVQLARGDCLTITQVLTTQQTAADGMYAFLDLAPGRYCVQVITPPTGGVTAVKGSGPTSINLKKGMLSDVNFPYMLNLQ